MRIVNSNVIDDVSEAVERGILGLRFLGNECLRDVICVYIVEDIEGCFFECSIAMRNQKQLKCLRICKLLFFLPF